MKNTLNSKALITFRKRKGWTQEQLCDKCKGSPSIAQISRWERGKSLNLRTNSREKLIKVLGVKWEDLTKTPPEPVDEESKTSSTVQLNIRVKPRIRTAFILACYRYNVRPADILELAPLLFLITAEKSLATRKKNLEEFINILDQVCGESEKFVPQISQVFSLTRYEHDEAIHRELAAINQRDVFSDIDIDDLVDFHSDDVVPNPYINYLKHLIEDLPDGLVRGLSPSFSRAPSYRIAEDTLREITGISGKTDKEMELLELINDGGIHLGEIIDEKKRLSDKDFEEWFSSKHEDAKADKKAMDDAIWAGFLALGAETPDNGGAE